jgi:hypothetical protein
MKTLTFKTKDLEPESLGFIKTYYHVKDFTLIDDILTLQDEDSNRFIFHNVSNIRIIDEEPEEKRYNITFYKADKIHNKYLTYESRVSKIISENIKNYYHISINRV